MEAECKKEISVAEIVYLLYFTVMFGARAVGLFEGMLIYNISLVIGMMLFAAKVLLTKHTVLEYFFAGSLLLVSMIVYYKTGEKGLLLYFTMMLGMKCVSVRRVFKLGTIILSIAFTVLVLLSVTGLKEDIIYIHERAGFGRIIRHSLGYPYPNTLFTTYIVLMVLIFHMLGKQSKKNLLLTTFFLFLGSIYIYLYSCSNTGLIVSVFYLMINLWLQLRRGLSNLEKAGLCLLYPLCLIFSIAGPLVTRGSLFQLLDRILHNRWAYSLYYLTNEPITLLGVRFKEAPNTNYMIDSSFLYSFLQLGLIPCVILTVLLVSMIVDYAKRGKKKELAMIACFCVLGLSDPFLFNLSYKNLMFLLAGEFVYRKMQMWGERNSGFWNYEIQLLPLGNKKIAYDTALYCKTSKRMRTFGATMSQHGGMMTIVYVASAALISGSVYAATYAQYILGRIDEVEEWEYFRKVLSLGVFAGAVIAAVLMLMIQRKSKKKESSGEVRL